MRVYRKVLFFRRGADDERGRERWSALLKEVSRDGGEEWILYVVRGEKPHDSSERWICRMGERPIATFERGKYHKVVLVYLEELLPEPIELTFQIVWRQEGSVRRSRLETAEFVSINDAGEVVNRLYAVDKNAKLQPETGRPYLCSVVGKIRGGELNVYIVNPLKPIGVARDDEAA